MAKMSTSIEAQQGISSHTDAVYLDWLNNNLMNDSSVDYAGLLQELDNLAAQNMHPSPASIDEHSPVGDAQLNETIDDADYESEEYDEVKTEKSRRFGRGILLATLRGADKWSAYSAGWLISKSPEALSMTERKQRQAELDEKYARADGDTFRDRIVKFGKRNRYHMMDRAVVYGLGALAVSRLAPHTFELGNDILRTAHLDFVPVVDATTYGGGVQTAEIKHNNVPTVFRIGGATDGDKAKMLTSQMKNAGLYDPNVINKSADYSGDIGPFVGTESLRDASDDAARQGFQAYLDSNGSPFTVYGFSEGSVGALKTANLIAEHNGGHLPDNVKVYADGGPNGVMGIFNNPLAKAGAPLLAQMGIDRTSIPAGAVVRTYSGDFWGNGGNQSFITNAAQLITIPQNHQPITGGELISRQVIDGVTYEEYSYAGNAKSVLGHALEVNNGVNVTPAQDAFLESLAPVTHLGEATQYTNVDTVGKSLAGMIEEQTGNTGIAYKVEGMLMTPQLESKTQALVDLQKLAPAFADMVNNPQNIGKDMKEVSNLVKPAVAAVKSFIPTETNAPVRDYIRDVAQQANIQLPPPKPVSEIRADTRAIVGQIFNNLPKPEAQTGGQPQGVVRQWLERARERAAVKQNN